MDDTGNLPSTEGYTQIEIVQQLEIAVAEESELELPEWFKPKNIIISNHSKERFIERIYPGLTAKETVAILNETIAECWWENEMLFFRSYTTSAWLTKIRSKKYNIEYLAAFDYEDVNKNGRLDDADLPVLVTVMHLVPPKYQVLVENIKSLNIQLKEAKEKLKVLQVSETALVRQKNSYLQQKLVAESQLEKALDKSNHYHQEREAFQIGLYEAFKAEKARGKSASKRQLKRLYDALATHNPKWVSQNDYNPIPWIKPVKKGDVLNDQ